VVRAWRGRSARKLVFCLLLQDVVESTWNRRRFVRFELDQARCKGDKSLRACLSCNRWGEIIGFKFLL